MVYSFSVTLDDDCATLGIPAYLLSVDAVALRIRLAIPHIRHVHDLTSGETVGLYLLLRCAAREKDEDQRCASNHLTASGFLWMKSSHVCAVNVIPLCSAAWGSLLYQSLWDSPSM